MSNLIMLTGVPGSGKTTIRKRLLKDNPDAFVISFDDIKESLYGPEGKFPEIGREFGGNYEKASRANPEIFDAEKEVVISKARESGKDIIFDTTGLTESTRRREINSLEMEFDKKIAIWADTPVDVAIKRNNARSRVVPEPVILSMSSTLEIPTKSGGFDEVLRFDSNKQQFFDMSSDKNVRIYIDMDGVVADFEKGVKDAGVELSPMGGSAGPEKANEFWGALGRVPNFYYNLEPIPEGVEMVKKLMEKYECVFLTGIPRAENEMMTAQLDKIKWAKKCFGNDVKVYPVKRYTKARFCNGRNSILIDDYMKNIREWEEAGGSGVQFKPDKDILKSVEQIVERNERNIDQQRPAKSQSQGAFYGYDALFIKADAIEKLRKSLGIQDKQLANKPHDYHVTMKYHGKHEPTDKEKEFQTKNNGQQMKCTIIGYGNDGKNEGFLCKGYQKDGRTPFHITLSMADGARAVDTGKMSFTRLEKPIEISGRFYNSLDVHVQNPAYQTFARNSSEVRKEPNKIKEKEDTREI